AASDSSPQVSSASARPREIPPRPGREPWQVEHMLPLHALPHEEHSPPLHSPFLQLPSPSVSPPHLLHLPPWHCLRSSLSFCASWSRNCERSSSVCCLDCRSWGSLSWPLLISRCSSF